MKGVEDRREHLRQIYAQDLLTGVPSTKEICAK